MATYLPISSILYILGQTYGRSSDGRFIVSNKAVMLTNFDLKVSVSLIVRES